MKGGSDRHFCSGGVEERVSLVTGSEASPACPSGRSSKKRAGVKA